MIHFITIQQVIKDRIYDVSYITMGCHMIPLPVWLHGVRLSGWGGLMFTMCSWVIVSKRSARTFKPRASSSGECPNLNAAQKVSQQPACKMTLAQAEHAAVTQWPAWTVTASALSQICPGALDTLTQTFYTQTSCCLNVCFVDMPALKLLFQLHVTVLHVSACLDLAQRTMRACLSSTQIQRTIFIKNSCSLCEAEDLTLSWIQ